MMGRDVRVGWRNNGVETNPQGEWFRARRVAGRILLALSVVLVIAGFPMSRATAASDANSVAGAEVFRQNGCEHCHGVDGIGTDRGPALTTIGKRMHKDEIEHQIRGGGKQMPPFQDVLNDEQVRQLVDYLSHKKKAPRAQAGR